MPQNIFVTVAIGDQSQDFDLWLTVGDEICTALLGLEAQLLRNTMNYGLCHSEPLATQPPYATRHPRVTQVAQFGDGEESASTNARSFATLAQSADGGPRELRRITRLEAQRLRLVLSLPKQ